MQTTGDEQRQSAESDEEEGREEDEEELLQQQDGGESDDEDPDDRPLCFLPSQPGQAVKTARTWRKGEKEKQFDDWGNVIPDDDPLATYKADFVWESPDGCQTVCFYGPMKKAPKNSTAATETTVGT